MSAVCGVVADDEVPDRDVAETVVRMLGTLHGYGGAGTTVRPARGVCLAQRQSSFFRRDALERQPVGGGAGRFALVADLRLSNVAELAAALDVGAASSVSDGALLMRAFERWGQECVGRLRGDFAFAIWDAATATLFCARDHLGARPLYYGWHGGAFAFASSIKAALQLRVLPRDLSDETVTKYLLSVRDPGAATFFTHVHCLPPGHALAVRPGAPPRLHRYYALEAFTPVVLRSPSDYVARVRELIAAAVAAALDTPHGVGVRLSGGLDSSAIACVAARALASSGRRLTALSAVLPLDHEGPEEDERAYIAAVVEQEPNIDWEPVTAPGLSPLSRLEEEFEHHLAPPYANFPYMDLALSERARACGVGVLLDGYPGDVTVSFTSVSYFTDLALRLRWVMLWREMTLLARAHGYGRRRLLRLIASRTFGRDKRRLIAAMRGTATAAACERSAIRPEFAQRTGLLHEASTFWEPPLRQRLLFRSRQRWDVDRLGFGPQNEYLAHAGARFGVHWCSPYVNLDLVETCLSAPTAAQHRDGFGRRLLRDGMDGILPPLVQWRLTKGAGSPDYHRRLLAVRAELVRDIERLRANRWLAERLDFDKMLAVLDRTRPGMLVQNWDNRAQLVVTNGHRLARFVEWLEGGPIDRVPGAEATPLEPGGTAGPAPAGAAAGVR